MFHKLFRKWLAHRAFNALCAWYDGLPAAEHTKHHEAIVTVLDILRIYMDPQPGKIEQ